MLRQRVVSALIGIPIFLFLLYVGGWPLRILIALIALFAAWEYVSILRGRDHAPDLVVVTGGALICVLAGNDWWGLMLTLAVIIAGMQQVGAGRTYNLVDWGLTVFGVAYVGFLLAHLVAVRDLPQGRELAFLVVLAVWASDTAAYFLGLRFGHRRLAPAISPKKSVEGAVAGLIAAALIAAVIMPELGYSPWYGGCLGLLISIAAQAGDLVESGLKRYCGVKDSGNIIPGHGGFLDRFDALLFAGPFVYYFAVLMMG